MLRHIWMETTLFAPRDNTHDTRKNLMWILEALVQRNQTYLKHRPETPRLYKSGVRYEAPKQFDGEIEEVKALKRALGGRVRDPEVARILTLIQDVLGGEHFCDIGVILERGSIDCDGLASWRVAELRQAGIPAKPWMTDRQRLDGGTTYHALVLWPPFGNVSYWTSEDPSLLLGMGGEARKADRNEEIRKNKERCEILQKYGLKGATSVVSDIEDVLGLRKTRAGIEDVPMVVEIEQLLKVA